MPNPETQEKASLYVLGLMSPAERAEFEVEQEANPALQAEVRSFQVNVEALALAAVPMTAPPGCFARIQEKIEGRFFQRWPHSRSPWMMLGWPLAASLALSWAISSYHFSSSRSEPKTSQPAARDTMDRRAATTPEAEPAVLEPPPAVELERQRVENARLQDALKREQVTKLTLLDRLGRQEARGRMLEDRVRSLIEVQPGMSRLLVFNMRDPRAKPPSFNVLEDPSQILANEANKRLSPSNQTPDNPLSGFNHVGVSTPNNNYETDAKTDATRSPATATNQISGPINLQNPPAPTVTNVPLTGAVILGYDQAVLNGYLLMNGTPPLTDSQNLQLWAWDGQHRQSVGLLPKMSNGAVQVNFKLDNLDFVPNRFFVTIEPAGGSMQPSGPVVLDGPGN